MHKHGGGSAGDLLHSSGNCLELFPTLSRARAALFLALPSLTFLWARFPSLLLTSFVPGLSWASCRSLRPSFTRGVPAEGTWPRSCMFPLAGCARTVAAEAGRLRQWALGAIRPCVLAGRQRIPAGRFLYPESTPEDFPRISGQGGGVTGLRLSHVPRLLDFAPEPHTPSWSPPAPTCSAGCRVGWTRCTPSRGSTFLS